MTDEARTDERTEAAEPAVALRGLAIGHAGRPLLSGIDLEVAPGEIFALLGGSGCGKSTLLRTIEGLLPPVAGRVEIGGRLLALVNVTADSANKLFHSVRFLSS